MAKTAARPSFQVELRPATKPDYGFVEGLYVETMKPLLQRLEAWNEIEARARFRSYYQLDEVRIITVDGRDAGFLQVSEKDDEITLAQIHIEAPYRSRGIGTALIKAMLRDARAKKKPVSLSVVKHNPAQTLYERLGFRVIGEDDTKHHMRWHAGSARPAEAAGHR
jgi:ribosomal protein S18 acetylase RimI-like enzyme